MLKPVIERGRLQVCLTTEDAPFQVTEGSGLKLHYDNMVMKDGHVISTWRRKVTAKNNLEIDIKLFDKSERSKQVARSGCRPDSGVCRLIGEYAG
mgnify:CR=1 FL=1